MQRELAELLIPETFVEFVARERVLEEAGSGAGRFGHERVLAQSRAGAGLLLLLLLLLTVLLLGEEQLVQVGRLGRRIMADVVVEVAHVSLVNHLGQPLRRRNQVRAYGYESARGCGC